MRYYINRGCFGTFRCPKNKNYTSGRSAVISAATGTWFAGHHIDASKAFSFMMRFCDNDTNEEARRKASNNRGLIGGPGKIVQINEAKIEQRKYQRGRVVEGHWLLGMIEDENEDLRLEMCPDNQRTTQVLIPLIQQHMAPGSTIHTDEWRAYNELARCGYIHRTVNHSREFVAADGIHTQRIEASWRPMRRVRVHALADSLSLFWSSALLPRAPGVVGLFAVSCAAADVAFGLHPSTGCNLSMGFRSWDLYKYPLLQLTTKHLWFIKTVTQLEKPRYVVFALQTGRKNVMSEDTSRFDGCKLTNVKLYLNLECYPYDDMNLDFDKNRWSILYDTYTRFCKNYYGYEYLEPSLTVSMFLRNGLFVIIDCSRQNKLVKSAIVDGRLEFECKENVPMNTTAYCLIIHNRVIQYNPLTNVVRKIT
ncbi:hypothetical protein RF55_8482 [Lasius niger]|uniref:ISXO2-like transposase domain-containing protein n=1 Tax=Lasius niger TaxID=67767 RepID=A0A0J7KMU3_LASNI|nr:hypothetical protein RF55_8482 [Lasius niger]